MSEPSQPVEFPPSAAPPAHGSASSSAAPPASASQSASQSAQRSTEASGPSDGRSPPSTRPQPSDRVWTVPNLLSMLRLAGVPLFLWLLLGPQDDVWALVVLAVSAITDWADGKLARLLDQYSRLGELLDPAADRLYILAALIGFVIRGFIPW